MVDYIYQRYEPLIGETDMTLASMNFVAPTDIKPLSKSLFNRLISTPISVIDMGPHNTMFRIVPDGKNGHFVFTSYENGSFGVRYYRDRNGIDSKYVGSFRPVTV
jgi:hypothetical protein